MRSHEPVLGCLEASAAVNRSRAPADTPIAAGEFLEGIPLIPSSSVILVLEVNRGVAGKLLWETGNGGWGGHGSLLCLLTGEM